MGLRCIFVLALGVLAQTSLGTLSAAADAGPPNDYLIDNWQLEHGLPQITVKAVLQDLQGYLWLATGEGLVRFDGVRFTVFDRRSIPQIRSNIIRSLALDGEGGLWIATREGLNHYANGRFELYSAADGLPHSEVETVHSDRQGHLWIGSRGGLSRIDGRSFVNYSTRDGLAHDSVLAIHSDRYGRVWIGTEGGLSRFERGRLTSSTPLQGIVSGRVQALYEDRRGRLWIASDTGLGQLVGESFVMEGKGSLPSPVWFIHEDRWGRLWAGTDDGLFERRDGAWVRQESLPDRRTLAFWEDREGGFWVGTGYDGLVRMRERKITDVSAVEPDVAWAIVEDRQGAVWIGTNNGLTRISADAPARTYTTRDGLPANDITALAEDRQGNLWVGTVAGVARFRDGRFRTDVLSAELSRSRVNCILEDRRGHLWLGTHGSGLDRVDGARIERFTVEDGLPSDVIRSLYDNADGALWIGTEEGLAYFRDGVFKAYGIRDGLPHRLVSSIHGDADGTLWVGTWGGGIARLRDEVFTDFSVRDGLLDDTVHQIIEDGRDRLWMSSNRGIWNVAKKDFEGYVAGKVAAVTSVSYDEYDGMPSRECSGGNQPAGIRARNGELWIPTLKGVAVVDAERLGNEAEPPVLIEEVVIDQRRFDVTRQAILGPATKTFSFRYTSPSFRAPTKIRFKYRLEGFDGKWVHAGDSRQAQFTNLGPGSYLFRVKARSRDGVWSKDGATFEFVVERAFHQTWTFFLLCAAAVLVLGRGAYRLRVRSLVRRNEELERIRRELEHRNAEMERFTYTMSHDLKTPLFTIQGFVGMAEQDAAQGKARRLREDLGKIRVAAAQMDRLLQEVLELSRVGRVVNPTEEVALADLAREAVELVLERSPDCGVRVKVDPDLDVVSGDRRRLSEVFQSLVENAVKFMGSQAEPAIEISVRRGKENVFYVRDNGMGIDPKYHQKIFGLFDQLDPQQEGTGIGLALAKRIVELHGGRIWVESQGRGQGSSFCFTIPVTSALSSKL